LPTSLFENFFSSLCVTFTVSIKEGKVRVRLALA